MGVLLGWCQQRGSEVRDWTGKLLKLLEIWASGGRLG